MLSTITSLILLSIMKNSAAQVCLKPSGHVVYLLSHQAALTCVSSTGSTIESVQWLVNDTHLEELNLTDVQVENVNGVESLIIPNITVEFNMTTIQCLANSDGDHSDITTLMIQGSLSAVNMIIISYDFIISLTWTAPFSLDITDVDPDITYCVDVVDSTSMSTLYSQCGLIDTGFNYSIPSSGVCGDYTFAITPVNVVGNGTSATVQYSQALTAPRVSEQQLMPLSSMDGVYTYQMTLSSLVCESELTFEDVDTGEEISLGGSDLIISNNTIMFTTAQLNTNRLYSISVSASNPSDSALSNTRISTHDVVEVAIGNNRDSSIIHITVTYFENATAKGAFLAAMFASDGTTDFERSLYLVQNRAKMTQFESLLDLISGSYLLCVYDIESDGTLENGMGYPATSHEFFIRSRSQNTISVPSSPHITGCNVTSAPDRVISSVCIYTSRVTGFQMIVQNSDLDKVHKLHINQTTNGDRLATVQVEEDGLYRVTIFPIYGDSGIVNSGVGYSTQLTIPQENSEAAVSISPVILGSGVGAAVIAVLALIGTCLFVCRWKIKHSKKTASGVVHTDVEPPVPDYEEVGDLPGAFKYTQCQVYGLSPDVLMNKESKDENDGTKDDE